MIWCTWLLVAQRVHQITMRHLAPCIRLSLRVTWTQIGKTKRWIHNTHLVLFLRLTDTIFSTPMRTTLTTFSPENNFRHIRWCRWVTSCWCWLCHEKGFCSSYFSLTYNGELLSESASLSLYGRLYWTPRNEKERRTAERIARHNPRFIGIVPRVIVIAYMFIGRQEKLILYSSVSIMDIAKI